MGTNNERRTGTLHGRSDTGDSGTDGVREITKTQRGFQLDLEIELEVSLLLNVSAMESHQRCLHVENKINS